MDQIIYTLHVGLDSHIEFMGSGNVWINADDWDEKTETTADDLEQIIAWARDVLRRRAKP